MSICRRTEFEGSNSGTCYIFLGGQSLKSLAHLQGLLFFADWISLCHFTLIDFYYKGERQFLAWAPGLGNRAFGNGLKQKLVLAYSQSVTFAIVSRRFENKKNNCCETKMLFVYFKKIVHKSNSGYTDWDHGMSRQQGRVARLGICLLFFFINKWHFCFTAIIFKTS